jgi:hypothetical protein
MLILRVVVDSISICQCPPQKNSDSRFNIIWHSACAPQLQPSKQTVLRVIALALGAWFVHMHAMPPRPKTQASKVAFNGNNVSRFNNVAFSMHAPRSNQTVLCVTALGVGANRTVHHYLPT